MPSNAELRTQAEELAEELEIEISTKGLNNTKLAELVSDLKAKKKDADNPAAEEAVERAAEEPTVEEPTAEEAVVEEPTAEEAVVEDKPPFYMMPGKAVTSKRGILEGGDEVKAEYLEGGEEALEALVSKGYVGKNT